MSVRYALGFVLFAVGCTEPPPNPAVPPAPPAASSATALDVAATRGSPVAAPSSNASAAPAPESNALVSPTTPEALHVPQSAHLTSRALANGAQIYVCGAKKDAPATFEWSLKAPDATLFDAQGKAIGKHFAGPTWESADGSKVVGALKAKVDAPNATAIPWLLLEAKTTEGHGAFSHVAFVQRVDTVGGKAPGAGCDKAHDHAEARAEYSATYYFYDQ